MTRFRAWTMGCFIAPALACTASGHDAAFKTVGAHGGSGGITAQGASAGSGGVPAEDAGGASGDADTGGYAGSDSQSMSGAASAGSTGGHAGTSQGGGGSPRGGRGGAGRSSSGGGGAGGVGNSAQGGGGAQAVAGMAGSSTGSGGGSTGCSSTAKPTMGQYTIRVGSKDRGYYLIPAKTSNPAALILEFHGAGGNGKDFIASFGLDTSLGGNAVIIAPDGISQGGVIGWASYGNGNDDIDLAKALIEQAQKDHCIDATHIYAVGFSWGGAMASTLACKLGSQLRGFVDVAGNGPYGSCVGPIGGMIVHGDADGTEPVASGIATRDAYKKLNGCTDTLADSDITGCKAYMGCSKPTLWCEHSGDHFIPQWVNDGLLKFFGEL
jgi:polyhydroxybutyrate depolymerase